MREMKLISKAQHDGLPFEDFHGRDVAAAQNCAAAVDAIQYRHDEHLREDVSILKVMFPTIVTDQLQQGDYGVAVHRHQLDYDSVLTPRSTTTTESNHTRSCRPAWCVDSHSNASISRVSKPATSRARRSQKSKLDNSRAPKLTAPLSILTKDMSIPMKDINAWVNRSLEMRRQEVEKRNGYVTRPMNSFMLYRSAFAERTKAWCTQNNHQVVSSVSGKSWPMESQEVRDQFNEWATVERHNHQAAHPEYKFSPSKLNIKRRRGEYSPDLEEINSVDSDLDHNHRASHRRVRRRRSTPAHEPPNKENKNMQFHSHPYFNQQKTDCYQFEAHHQTGNQFLHHDGLTDPMYGLHVLPYSMQAEQYGHPDEEEFSSYQYGQEVGGENSSMSQMTFENPVGGYGLPSGHQRDLEIFFPGFHNQIPTIPAEQYHYQSGYSDQQLYEQAVPVQQMYEPQQWLREQCQPQMMIDPDLEADFAAFREQSGQCYPNVISYGHMGDPGSASMMPGYFQECANPNGDLTPIWNVMD
nr:transcription factor ste11 [Quercus suber]